MKHQNSLSAEQKINSPQQKRSRESQERVITTAIKHISEGAFENISVNQLAKDAETSVGAFYARFQNKENLFHVVQERVFQDAMAFIEKSVEDFCTQFSPEKHTSPVTTQQVVKFTLSLLLDFYQRHAGVFRELFLRTRVKRDPELLIRVAAFNKDCLAISLKLLALIKQPKTQSERMLENQSHPTLTAEKWLQGLAIVAVSLRENVLFSDPVPGAPILSTKKLLHLSEQMLNAWINSTD